MSVGVQKSNPRYRRSMCHWRRCKLDYRHVRNLNILERCHTECEFENDFVRIGQGARVDAGWKQLLCRKFEEAEAIPEPEFS